MRTDDYIILMPAVEVNKSNITVNYTSNAPEHNISAEIKSGNGRTVKVFQHIKNTMRGQLIIPTEGLMPGTYTCNIYLHTRLIQSKIFSVF